MTVLGPWNATYTLKLYRRATRYSSIRGTWNVPRFEYTHSSLNHLNSSLPSSFTTHWICNKSPQQFTQIILTTPVGFLSKKRSQMNWLLQKKKKTLFVGSSILCLVLYGSTLEELRIILLKLFLLKAPGDHILGAQTMWLNKSSFICCRSRTPPPPSSNSDSYCSTTGSQKKCDLDLLPQGRLNY